MKQGKPFFQISFILAGLLLIAFFIVLITKTKQFPKGIDLYFENKLVAERLAHRLNNKFDLKTKKTFEQHGWNKMKDKPNYRTIILLRR